MPDLRLRDIESTPPLREHEVEDTCDQQRAALKRTTKYAALDVHKTTTSASVRKDGGRIIVRTVIPTEEVPIAEFFRGRGGTIHVVFEEGTQTKWLHDLLVPLVDRVMVCDRREESRQGNKGVQVDADEPGS
jgi:hypothetical protein